jgi:hypothetical protein
VIVSASLFLAFAGESYFGAKCPTDDAVIAWFHASKRALDDLLNMVAADDEKVTHVDHGTVEVRPGTALPETRKEEYLSKLRETGAASFIYQRNEGSTVTLGTDAISTIESISKVCRYMDIRYIENISKWHQAERLRPTLDGLETNGMEGFWATAHRREMVHQVNERLAAVI